MNIFHKITIFAASVVKDELHDEGGLLSLEKLDRASPDLWPEKSN